MEKIQTDKETTQALFAKERTGRILLDIISVKNNI